MGQGMSVASADAVERSVHKTNEWLNGIRDELGQDDREEAWRILKADLQVLRDQLTIDEAAQFAAQLPLVLRGAFYEGFDPGRQDKVRHREEFLALFAERANLSDSTDAEQALSAATSVLSSHVTPGELDDLIAQLPSDLRSVLH
jgi:uncharacterized protein (DUF2267 family)